MSKRKHRDGIMGATIDQVVLDELQDYQRDALQRILAMQERVGPITRKNLQYLLPDRPQWLRMASLLSNKAGFASPTCAVEEESSSHMFLFILEDRGHIVRTLTVARSQIEEHDQGTPHIKRMIWDRILNEVLALTANVPVEEQKSLPWDGDGSRPTRDIQEQLDRMQQQQHLKPAAPPPPPPPAVSPAVSPTFKEQADAEHWRELVEAYRDCIKAGYDTEDIGEVLVTMVEEAMGDAPEPEPESSEPEPYEVEYNMWRPSKAEWMEKYNVRTKQEARKLIRISDISSS